MKPCPNCEHDFDEHCLVMTADDPCDGGITLCPVLKCECYSTWGIDAGPMWHEPDRFEVAALREYIQR